MSAALVVSLISLPLSMALAIAIGLPPQHGLYTAIVAGIAASLLGGSKFQISGPTAAFVVILIPIVSEFGLRGLLWCQMGAGCILLLFAVAKLGRLFSYVPYTVTTGFTAGIAVVLATLSLKDFMGLPSGTLDHHFIGKITALIHYLPALNGTACLVGIATLAIIIGAKKWIRYIPSPIIGVIGGTLLGQVLIMGGIDIPTIGSEFTYIGLDGLIKGDYRHYRRISDSQPQCLINC